MSAQVNNLPTSPVGAQKRSARTVMIIDDDPAIVQVLQHVVAHMGLDSACADRWADAIEVIEDRQPDLVLLDVRMPSVDGPTLLAYLRDQGMDVPVFIVSASIDEINLGDLRRLGVKQFVPKPFSVARLEALIEEELAEASHRQIEGSGGGATRVRRGPERPPGSSRRKRNLRMMGLLAVACLVVTGFVLVGHLLVRSNTMSAFRSALDDSLKEQSRLAH